MSVQNDPNPIPDPARFTGIGGPAGESLFPGGFAGSPDDRAAAIRAAADGELTDEQVASLGDAGAQISFERRLREATGRVMGAATAPAGLRERILSDSGASAAAATGAAEEDEALAEALENRAIQTRSPAFWGSGRMVGAVAAAMLLAVIGGFLWQSGGRDGTGGSPGSESPMIAGLAPSLAYRTSLARFVAGEHTRTLDDAYADRKYIYKAPDAAASAMEASLHHVPTIPPCGGATKFAGASPCGVPGKGPSAHMQFVLPVHDENGEIIEGASGRKVSVFVKQDKGELEIPEGTTYLINAQACNLSDVYLCVWRRDGLLYTLVSEGRNEPMCTKFLAQFGVEPPDPANQI